MGSTRSAASATDITHRMIPNRQTSVARHAGRARSTGKKEDQLSPDSRPRRSTHGSRPMAVSRLKQSESSTLEVAGVIHLDGTVCRTAPSRRSESRGASACSAAIASAAVDWMVSASCHVWPTRAARTRGGGCAAAFGQRGVLIAVPAGAWVVVPDVVAGADDSGQQDQRTNDSDPRRLTQVG